MKFKFTKIKTIDNNGSSVEIIATSPIGEIKLIMSILQLAKIWQVDSELTNDFGSSELEEKCKESLELIKTFPKITVKSKSILFDDFFLQKDKEGFLIIVEDMCGWSNEGIRIYLSDKIYDFSSNNNLKKIKIDSKSINFLEKKI